MSALPAWPATLDSSLAFGGLLGDSVRSVALGPRGGIFIAGHTDSRDLPKTISDSPNHPGSEAYVARFDGSPLRLRWVQVLGGGHADAATSVSVTADGAVIFAGHTSSNDFGSDTGLPLVEIEGLRDLFIGKLAFDGEIQELEVLRGDGFDTDPVIIATPSGGWIVAASTTSTRFSSFATEDGGALGGGDGVVLFVQTTGERNAVFLGGAGADEIADIATWEDDTLVVVGRTNSSDFPTLAGSQSIIGGGLDGFILQLVNRELEWATFVGGPGDDEISGVAVGPDGEMAVAGTVQSDGLSTIGVEQVDRKGLSDPLVMYWRGDPPAVEWSTYLGGDPGGLEIFREDVRGVAITASGNVVVSGQANPDFPLASPIYQYNGGGTDAFVAELNNEGRLEFSTYLGGSREDTSVDVGVRPNGLIQVVGTTTSLDFPLIGPGSFESRGSRDVTVTSLGCSGGLRHCGFSLSPLAPSPPVLGAIDTATGLRAEWVLEELRGNGATGVGFTDSGELFLLLTGQIAFPEGRGAQVFPRAGVAFYDPVSLEQSAMIRTSAGVTAAIPGKGIDQLVVLTSRNILIASSATYTVAVGPVDVGGRNIALNRDTESLFVAGFGTVVELSAVDLSMRREFDFTASDVGIDDTGRVILIDHDQTEIVGIEPTGGTISVSVAIRSSASDLAIRGTKAFVAHGAPSGSGLGGVTVVDLEEEQVLREVVLDGPTASLFYDSGTDSIYISQRDGRWFVMDGESHHLRQVSLDEGGLPTQVITVARSLACDTLLAPRDCPGDCDNNGAVSINELVRAVQISLGAEVVSECTAVDTDGDTRVSISEIIAAVASALAGCSDASSVPGPTARVAQ